MLASSALYAAKKRKKPQQKIPKPPPPEGAKSNPSKRHRDRLNGELDKLTSLLPFTEEVRARLDKLSVLRLSVGYLKVKSFFNATLKNGANTSSWHSNHSVVAEEGDVQNTLTPRTLTATTSTTTPSTSLVTSIDGVSFSEGDLLLQALNSFVLVVTSEGYVFYTSPTIQEFLGFHQSDVVHQSAFELIHTDDRALFRRQLHFAFNPHSSQEDGIAETNSEQSSSEVSANMITYDPQTIPPENSSFLERNFCCRFRCLLDNSSGFLALNFRGRLKLLHGQNRVSENGTQVPPQLALFAIATPLQPPSILEIRTKTLIFQSKHKLDFTPIGIDTRGTVVLGYSDTEICMKGSGYSFIHAADMMYCADNHVTMMKTGQSVTSVFRLLTKKGTWVWVQATARLVLKGDKPDFIVARQRLLSNEEGEEQLRLRRLEVSFSFTTGEALLYDLVPTVDTLDTCSTSKQRKLDQYTVNPNSILGVMLNQDQSVYCELNSTKTMNDLNDMAFKDTHATVSIPGDVWQHSSSNPAVESLVKSEDTIQEMMETLQQILGDGDLIDTVDVRPEELKSWESTVMKVKSNSCEMSGKLNELISEDIFLYVEEQLQKEGGLTLPDQIVDSIPVLNQQNQGLADPSFSWPLEPQSQLFSGEQMMSQQPSHVPGMMKLTHIELPQLKSSSLKSPAMEHIASQQTLSLSTGIHGDRDPTGGPPPSFVPALGASCAGTSKKSRTVKENNLLSLRQPNHIQAAQPMQHCHQQRVSNLPVDHYDQIQAAFSLQNSQWNSNHADAFVERYTQNVSNGPVKGDPPAPSSMQSHLELPAQNGQNQRGSWQLQQQLEPELISNGQRGMNQLPGFQPNPGFALTQNTLSGPLLMHGLRGAPVGGSSSCMFNNNPPSLPVNGGHVSQMLPYQTLKHVNNHIPDSPACCYQGEGGSTSHSDTAPLSCQMTPGVDLGGRLMQQQQYLNFSDQLNNHSVVGNRGGAFPHCQTGPPAPQRTNRKQL
ncbi:aryl hydrocarbon receptor 2 [Dunckerocampus dactyliophorus]|uniref:aryl hydrocarbon receptor 2 n=1 Tax=Dunckerocampus dactyliophorus TaxID=161453 RepID=UPI0024070410|nr:aryl hydrocarbon receptor 2 [Dunckerocampus dactyliophorus]